MKPTIIAALISLSSLVFTSAYAQEAALCEELAPFIQAAREKTPFESMHSPTNPMVPGPTHLGEGKKCQIYIAGDKNGVRGGGPHNYASCLTFYGTSNSGANMEQVTKMRDQIQTDLLSCKALAKFGLNETVDQYTSSSERVWSRKGKKYEFVLKLEKEKVRPLRKSAKFEPYDKFELKFVIRAPVPKVKKKK